MRSLFLSLPFGNIAAALANRNPNYWVSLWFWNKSLDKFLQNHSSIWFTIVITERLIFWTLHFLLVHSASHRIYYTFILDISMCKITKLFLSVMAGGFWGLDDFCQKGQHSKILFWFLEMTTRSLLEVKNIMFHVSYIYSVIWCYSLHCKYIL